MNMFVVAARNPQVQKVASEVALLLAKEVVRLLTKERPMKVVASVG